MLKTEFEFYEILASKICSLICLVSEITQKKDKLQAENILDILQNKFGTRYIREQNLKEKHSSSAFFFS
jgi:hypothetical protein